MRSSTNYFECKWLMSHNHKVINQPMQNTETYCKEMDMPDHLHLICKLGMKP